jgi:TPR repeat protein
MAGEGAIEICQQAAREHPGNLAVQRDLARSLIAFGDFEAAVEVYQRIAEARPDDVRAQADLGGSLGFIRRYAEAVAPMERAMQLQPDDVGHYRAGAVVYAQLGRMADAVRVTLMAAHLGDAISMYDLVGHYREGVGVAADPAQAMAWAERAAERGHLGALELMVRVYVDGLLGQAPDPAKAGEWASKFRRAQLSGDGPVQR